MKRIIDPTKSFPNLKILGRLSAKMSGSVWDGAEKDLFEYNKTIITLSSSALVLSFTVIRLGNISLNKVLIGSSWTLFLLVILSGVLIQFSKFLYRLTDEVVKQGSNDGGYKKGELFSELEIPFYFASRFYMFWISVFQLVSFWFAFVLLMLAAFISIL